MTCQVRVEGKPLILDGLPYVWPRTRLIPDGTATFAIESLPFMVEFVVRATGESSD